ncbi:MAG: hypothetical protein EXR62_04595 [Chloroflexi bacterium]|nr:hypothetical protein [Chloroflexota bacterium]
MSSRVTIREDRILEFNGQPFFALQGRHMPVGASLKDLAEAGFNCFRLTSFGGMKMSGQPMPEERYGLKICAYLYNRMNLHSDPAFTQELTAVIERLKDHPDLLAYETYNEPAWRPDAPMLVSQTAEDLATGYQLVKKIDPYHPIHQGHSASATVEALQEYNIAADIVGCNPYPVMPPHMRQHVGIRPDGRALDSPDQQISAVADYTAKMVQVGESQKPVWMQLQAMAWEDFYSPLWRPEFAAQGKDPGAMLHPTYAQMRYMAFANIINGASGLLFSMYQVALDQPVWQDIRRLVGELRDLHDILAGHTTNLPLRPRYRNLGYSIWKGVQILVKQAGDQLYLLAANSAFDPAEVTWSGFNQTSATHLRVLGEERQVPIHNGAATDTFEPYAVHVYALTS